MNAEPPRQSARDKPNWGVVEIAALLPQALPRVLAGMGFDLHCGTVRRGNIRWWEPGYQRLTPWRRRIGESKTVVGEGFRRGAWTDDAVASHDRQDAIERERLAELNRGTRDRDVLIMGLRLRSPRHRADCPVPDTHDCYAIDTETGEWRTPNGAQQGEGMITLGMTAWLCRYGQAGYRVARLAGMAQVPLHAE
jgi:hypothetical protein